MEKTNIEIRPVSAVETHIYVNGKEIHKIREYSIKQKAGQLPIVTIKLNGEKANYSIDTDTARVIQPNIFRELWNKINKNFLRRNKGKIISK